MGDTPFGSSARLSGDFERSFERERERLEGMLSESCSMWPNVELLLMVIEYGLWNRHLPLVLQPMRWTPIAACNKHIENLIKLLTGRFQRFTKD